MERHFEHDLEELKKRLLWMASLSEHAVHRAVQSVFEKNDAFATEVLEGEKAINDMQIEIDDRVMQLVALQAPMAADLRFILASSRINNDLE
ncbi:MAG: PhoU domain-containing protein, partial [Candidatus Acidiferrales bacterium]